MRKSSYIIIIYIYRFPIEYNTILVVSGMERSEFPETLYLI